MCRCIFTYGLMLFFVVGLCSGAVAGNIVGAAAVSDEGKYLPSLVRSYFQESSGQAPDELLSRILNHRVPIFNLLKRRFVTFLTMGKRPLGRSLVGQLSSKGGRRNYRTS